MPLINRPLLKAAEIHDEMWDAISNGTIISSKSTVSSVICINQILEPLLLLKSSFELDPNSDFALGLVEVQIEFYQKALKELEK